jgi:hypothetical protein
VIVELLESRRLFAGVTLVTHGFNSNASDWVTAMGNAIAAQSGPLADQPRYKLTVDNNAAGGAYEASVAQLGPPPAGWGSDEIIVLLDWSDVAGALPPNGSQRPTGEVGNFVADELMTPGLIPGFAPALAELPIHLIGHSRGAGLISEIARRLGEHGVWVDQLTYLDPHPVDGVNDLGYNFNDTPMRVYDNVRYAEDFWREDTNPFNFFDFDGEAVSGAYNLQLSESTLSSGGYSIEHSDVHLWYHGTVGPPFADSDGGASVGSNWYTTPASQGPRDQTGWHYSRLARGVRPMAGLKTAGAHRDAVALSVSGANVWDDISIDNLTADTTLTQGTSLAVNATFEDRSTGGTRDSTITVGFDRDDNPYNGVFGGGVSVATASLGSDSWSTNLATANIAGSFRVYAKIANGVNTRYYYAPARVIVTAAGADKTWIGPAGGDWSAAGNWYPAGVPGAADRVAIYDSDVTLGVTAKIAALAIGGAGTLDIADHDLIIDYPSVSPIGTWTGTAYDGVTGLIAAGKIRSGAVTSSLHALGVAESADALDLENGQTRLWKGQTVDASAVLVKFTYAGDATLDGKLNVDDYGRIDSSINLPIRGWFNGDFNLDGKVNVDDYGIIDSNIGIQGPPIA